MTEGYSASSQLLDRYATGQTSHLGLRGKLEMNAFKYGQQVRWIGVADYGDTFNSAVRIGRTLSETATISETRTSLRPNGP